MRSDDYHNGRREAIKWAVTWLHDKAKSMNDPHAKNILNVAAFCMGQDAKRHSVGGSMDFERKADRIAKVFGK